MSSRAPRPFGNVLLLLALVPGWAAAQAARGTPRQPLDPARVFEVEELAPGVWGALVIPRPSTYAFANSLVVEGEDGVLVVDTQQSPSAARALIELIGRRTDAPVRWVVNTHWHGDHVYGNEAYRDRFPGVHFFAHHGTRVGVENEGAAARARELVELPATIEARAGWLASGEGPDGTPLTKEDRAAVQRSLELRAAYLEELRALRPVPPDVTFDERLTLHLGGGRVVELLHFGPAHTAGDVVVRLPAEGILAVGDLLEEGPLWLEGARVAGWSSALEAVSGLEAPVLLPAHGGVHRDDGLLALQRGLLAAAVAAARAALRDGVGVEEAARAADLEAWRAGFAELAVRGDAFDEMGRNAVRGAYRELSEAGAGRGGR